MVDPGVGAGAPSVKNLPPAAPTVAAPINRRAHSFIHRPSYLIANIPKTPLPNCMEIVQNSRNRHCV